MGLAATAIADSSNTRWTLLRQPKKRDEEIYWLHQWHVPTKVIAEMFLITTGYVRKIVSIEKNKGKS